MSYKSLSERICLSPLVVAPKICHSYTSALYFKNSKSLEAPSSTTGRDWHALPPSKIFVENWILDNFWLKYFSISVLLETFRPEVNLLFHSIASFKNDKCWKPYSSTCGWNWDLSRANFLSKVGQNSNILTGFLSKAGQNSNSQTGNQTPLQKHARTSMLALCCSQ